MMARRSSLHLELLALSSCGRCVLSGTVGAAHQPSGLLTLLRTPSLRFRDAAAQIAANLMTLTTIVFRLGCCAASSSMVVMSLLRFIHSNQDRR